MIYIDSVTNLPMSKSDCGDSLVRAAIISVSEFEHLKLDIYNYTKEEPFGKTYIRRHSYQEPWNNYKNCTRDQKIMWFMWAKYLLISNTLQQEEYFKLVTYITSVLKTIKSNGWKLFNTERDYPGSTKYWYPHWFIDRTENGKKRFKLTDGPDRLLPGHIWSLSKAFNFQLPLLYKLLGPIWFKLDLLYNKFFPSSEQTQIIAQCYLVGQEALDKYRKIRPDYLSFLQKYWKTRGEIEYAEMTRVIVEGETNN